MPGDPPHIRKFRLFTGAYAEGFKDCSLACAVDCTDLAGVSEHSFFFDSENGLRHYFGFRKALSRRQRMRVRLTKIIAGIRALKNRADRWVAFENQNASGNSAGTDSPK